MRLFLYSLVLFLSCAHIPAAESRERITTAQIAPAATNEGPILFETDVNEMSVFVFMRQLEAANASAKGEPVVVIIDTPGGSVLDGIVMGKAIERSKAQVICVVDGMAASMGLYILQSCDVRLMTGRSLLMGHEPASGARGQPDELGQTEELLRKLSHAMAAHIVHRMNISVAEYEAKIAHGAEWWTTAEEALAVGAIDGIVPAN